MHKSQEQVREFHLLFDLPAPEKPLTIDPNAALRCKLIVEEAAELFEAQEQLWEGNILPLVDNLVDLLYFVYGAGVALGVDLEPFFDAVHGSNMSKGACQACGGKGEYRRQSFPDFDLEACNVCRGTGFAPVFRTDGKVGKSSYWKEADLQAVWDELYGCPA